MASKLTSRPLRGPGELIVNPTVTDGRLAGDVGTDFGGVRIGWAAQAVLVSSGVTYPVSYESTGELGDVLEANNLHVFSAFLRGWDDDAVRLFLAGGYEQGESGHAVYQVPGTRAPGQSALSRAVTLLFRPTDHVNVPSVLLYRGVPDWTEGAELAMNRRAELGIPLAVLALRDENVGAILRVGLLRDL